MKARNTMKILMTSILGLLMSVPISSFAQQEYDDMYFNPNDRKEIKSETEYNSVVANTKATDNRQEAVNPTYSSKEYGAPEENYSAKNVNPEYIERYKSSSKDSYATGEEENGDGSYYVEDYNRADMPNNNKSGGVTNNYYNYYGYSGYNRFNNPWMYSSYYDPFWGWTPGMSFGLGSYYGFSPGWSFNLRFGSGWGYYDPWYNPYSYYSPWYSPYYSSWAYNPWYYDSWYYPYYSYRNPYYYGYSSGYYNGYYSGLYGSHSYDNGINYKYSRRVPRGTENQSVVRENVPNRRTAISQVRPASDQQAINRRTETRDYSRTQNEYYSRSSRENINTTRSNATSARTSSENRTIISDRNNARNTIGTTSTPRVRSSRSEMDYSRPTYRNNTRTRTSTPSYNYNRSNSSRSSSPGSSSGYQRSSRTPSSNYNSRSYSAPSRSSSGSRSYNYSGGSNSRSSYSGGSSPSRSSSGSGSYGGGSRSSRSHR